MSVEFEKLSPAPAAPPAVLECVVLTLAIGVTCLAAALAHWLVRVGLGALSGPVVGGADQLVGGARYAVVLAAGLALLLRRARTRGGWRLAGEALALTVLLAVLPAPLELLTSSLPPALGGRGGGRSPGEVLTMFLNVWAQLGFWFVTAARALGFLLAARARGRAWQGLAWAGPSTLAWLLQIGLWSSFPAIYVLSALVGLAITSLLLPTCVRRADAWLARRMERDGPAET